MEKRLFIAIGLSLLIVWMWSFTTKKTLHLSPKVTETYGRDDVTNNKKIQPPPISGNSEAPLEIAGKSNEEIIEVESEKLKIQVSSVGAGIRNILIKDYGISLPLEEMITIPGYENFDFILIGSNSGEIVYQCENEEFKILKKFVMVENDYLIEAEISIQNKTDMSKLVSPKIVNYMIRMSTLEESGRAGDRNKDRDKSLNEYVINSEKGIYRKAGAFKFSPKEAKNDFSKVFWSGFRNRYFCAIIKPQYETKGYSILPLDDKRLKIETEAQEVTILPQATGHFNSMIYVGPEKTEILQSYRLGFEKIKRYYRLALFDGIAMIIDSLMNLIHKAIPSWGLCIILISTIIYFAMYPLTARSMLSMKKMQTLQPMVTKLKEKYKDNPQKMNKEMMELYKEHKVNPFGGCLPMLLQMPVFIGLYQVLWRSVSFKGAKFLWIKDLSEPDRLFTFPTTLPIIGNEFNILPVLMIFIMFFQQKLSSKNMVISDPSQAAQQKMMTTIMPVFLGFIFYKFASGLTLYFTMFYLFSVFTQWKMSKQGKPA